MNKPILRHICKVEYCAAYHLKSAIILPAQAKAFVREPMPWQELPLVGLASLEVTDEVENGVRIYTSKLTATLCKSFQHPLMPHRLPSYRCSRPAVPPQHFPASISPFDND